MQSTLVSVLALAGACLAHGDHGEHSQKPIVAEDANWMTKHMAGKFTQVDTTSGVVTRPEKIQEAVGD